MSAVSEFARKNGVSYVFLITCLAGLIFCRLSVFPEIGSLPVAIP